MKGKQKPAPVQPSALLEYITKTQHSYQQKIARLDTPEERRAEQFACNVMLWEVDAAQKYKFTQSALAMIERLRPQEQGAIKSLPGTGIWMMLDDEKFTSIYFSSIAHATTSYCEMHLHAQITPQMQIIANAPWLWDFQVMAVGEHPLFYLYDADRGRWTLNRADLCPVGRCELLGVGERRWPSWYICDVCKPKFDYWTSWFPVALMAVNGEFATTEERPEPKRFTLREKRAKRTGKGVQEVPVNHTFQVITFDISVKPQLPEREPDARDESTHPTWLEQAITDETVLYVERHIAQTSRTFRHARYVNMRGKTIDVRSYEKRVPMSVKRLKHTIYQAVASR